VNRWGTGAGLNPVGTRRCGVRDLRPPCDFLEGELAMAPDLIRSEWASSRAWGSIPPPSALESERWLVGGPRGKRRSPARGWGSCPPLSAPGTSSGSWVPARLLRGELRKERQVRLLHVPLKRRSGPSCCPSPATCRTGRDAPLVNVARRTTTVPRSSPHGRRSLSRWFQLVSEDLQSTSRWPARTTMDFPLHLSTRWSAQGSLAAA